MRPLRLREHRLIWLSPQALAAATELGDRAGMRASEFIETMVLKLLAFHRDEQRRTQPASAEPGVIPIEQARGKRRIRRRQAPRTR